MQSAPAARRAGNPAFAADPFVARRREAAPNSNIPVTPPPIALSVNATSTAESLTQTIASSSP